MNDLIENLYNVKQSNNAQLINNYQNALKQKYNAVCLDIDGTLTNNITEISDEILEVLFSLLEKKVPIVFVTGRGVTGTKEFVSNLMKQIDGKYGADKNIFSKIFALVNDGAMLLSTSNIDRELFDIENIMVSNEELNKLKYLNGQILSMLTNDQQKSYSFSSDGNLLNIRFVFNNHSDLAISKLTNELQDLIELLIPTTINITKGFWNNKLVIQVGISNKGNAIKTTEKLIGVPENSMLRIGDCGDINGNDYEMLNCKQGFSVNKYSNSLDGCFPIVNENGIILKGFEGTAYLLTKLNILPTICLEKADEYSYKKKYADIERQINIGKSKMFSKYNNQFNTIFKNDNGFDGIFEKNIGGIIIPLYEWELIDDNDPLKTLFSTNISGIRKFSLYTEDSVLLRGSENYYYFLKEREEVDKTEILSRDNVVKWLNSNMNFFCSAFDAVKTEKDFESPQNRKMILGILDCIRNYLLININAIITERYSTNIMLNFEQLQADDILKVLYSHLCTNTKIMADLCFNPQINQLQLLHHVGLIVISAKEFNNYFNSTNLKGDYSKIFRVYREIDNFIENYITMDLAASKISKTTDYDSLGICGLAYGGIELPIIAKTTNPAIDSVSVIKFNSQISSYRKKHSIEIRNFCIDDFGSIELFGIDKSKKYVLTDDNLLTAKTMQLALNTMYDKKISIGGIIIVRYPSMNRIDQMFMDGHGAVDPSYFFSFINGLGFPSPYSYMDDKNSYVDSLGVFDITRDKILRCLYKNHDFRKNSEVGRLRS